MNNSIFISCFFCVDVVEGGCFSVKEVGKKEVMYCVDKNETTWYWFDFILLRNYIF